MGNGHPRTKIRRGLTPVRITTGDHKGNYGLVPTDEYWDELGRIAYEAYYANSRNEYPDWSEIADVGHRDWWVAAVKAVAERIRDEYQ